MSNFIETISEAEDIQALTMDLIKSAKKEILGLFSTSNGFHRQSVLVLFLWPTKFQSRKGYQ